MEREDLYLFAGCDLEPKFIDTVIKLANNAPDRIAAAEQIISGYQNNEPLSLSQISLFLSCLRIQFEAIYYPDQIPGQTTLYFDVYSSFLRFYSKTTATYKHKPPKPTDHLAENPGQLVKITRHFVEVDNQKTSGTILVSPHYAEQGEYAGITFYTS